MRIIYIFLFLFLIQPGYTQVVLKADGPGETYELITSILAPGFFPIEVPDCNHNAFGDHIDEVFDNELNTHVFRFHIHTDPDNDRCINFDRQRNEIKSYDKSPDNLLGIENETVVYKWKFKLSEGFQASPNFTHLHQLKSVGGSLASHPMYTLTARKSTPDRLELRYGETVSSVIIAQTPLAPFIDTWLDVTETITYGELGMFSIEIKSVSDDNVLFSYSNDAMINWRPGASFVRPKWGIYRGLNNVQDLRDEMVFFDDFSIEEIDLVGSEDVESNSELPVIFSNPFTNTIDIKEISQKIKSIRLLSIDGQEVLAEQVDARTALNLDVSFLPKGIYALNFLGDQFSQSTLILVAD